MPTAIDLAASYAYSDSVYDTPLLAAVGIPVRGQPRSAHGDDGCRAPVADHRPVGRRFRHGRRIPVVNMEIQRLALSFTHPLFIPYAKFDIDGVENIPADGPGDHRRQPSELLRPDGDGRSRSHAPDRTVRFLGKKEVFDAPIVGQLAAAMGGIRVDRGTGSDEPLQAAADALEHGEHGGDHAAGNDPARPGILRSGVERPLGRGQARRDDRCAGDPGRAVGNREGVAAVCPPAQRAQHRRPADCHHPRRFSRCR